MENILYFVSTHDPWKNLAREEYLFQSCSENQSIFYLWQNQNTVVIGKNQNPWQECQIKLLEQEHGKIARRTSGGGAVFHDLGNLNFTFILPKNIYNLQRQLGVILDALRSLGIIGEFKGRNDLVVRDRKFSGNAFSFGSCVALHHGTLLVSADLDKLTRYLQVSQEKIKAKGIASIRSRVINLQECIPQISIQDVANALEFSFQRAYGPYAQKYYDDEYLDKTKLEEMYQRHSSWDWRFGQAPEFDLTLTNRFEWASIEMGLKLSDGLIKECKVYSDAMDEELISNISVVLLGCRLDSKELIQRLQSLPTFDPLHPEQSDQITDIIKWLQHKQF